MEIITEKKSSSFEPDFEVSRITNFLNSNLSAANANGFVVGISGGIDSAVVASLCQRAVGPTNVIGLLMFEDYYRSSKDFEDARNLIQQLQIRPIDVHISPIIEAFEQFLTLENIKSSKIVLANIKARIRMTLLYAVANHANYLVAGTGDRSEDMIGYFTKYGDGGVDILPISHLYKGQVRLLGRLLGVAESIVTKPSSPNLWKGHKATDEIPADYDTLDKILTLLYDHNIGPMKVCELTGAPMSVVDEVIRRNLNSRHKRSYPAMLSGW
jgi:NAD+ synthase